MTIENKIINIKWAAIIKNTQINQRNLLSSPEMASVRTGSTLRSDTKCGKGP